MTRILIIGLGSIGRRHLRNLVALGEGDLILLRSHRSTLPDDELAGFPVETDLQAALRVRRPEAVIIANPTSLHLETALAAAQTGCTILLEKPVSHSLEGLERLQAVVERTGSKVLVGFQFRFHPCLVHASELISSAELGRIMTAHVHYGEYLPGWHPWEDYRQGYAARADLGGGVLLTQCHSLDYVPWLLGEVQSVWGFLGKLSDLKIDVDDTAEVGLRFVDGALASVHLDYAQQPPSHHFHISFANGFLNCDLLSAQTRVYASGSQQWAELPPPEKWERNVMFLDEMRHFLAVARGISQPACSLDDGIRVMRLIAAVQGSSRSGRLVSLQE